ncbi:MAG: hypothetical protein RI894_715, partial [Bacteroidota bacterium]
FNGKEKSDEMYGEGNAYDFGNRINDPRIGRWLSLDPLAAKYSSMSPYCSMGNNPIMFVDPDGRDLILTGTPDQAITMINKGIGIKNTATIDNETGKVSLKPLTDEQLMALTSEQQNFYLTISNVSEKDKKPINIYVTENSEIIIGSYSAMAIDIEDIKQFPTEGAATQYSILAHEIVEQQAQQDRAVAERKFPGEQGFAEQKEADHQKGMDTEEAITGCKRIGYAASTKLERSDPKSEINPYGNTDILYTKGEELYKCNVVQNKEQNITKKVIITNETSKKNEPQNKNID